MERSKALTLFNNLSIMAIFTRIVKFADGSISKDLSHPLFNKYSANFMIFEQGTLNKEASENENVDVILLPDGTLTASLANGKKFQLG